MALFRSHHGFAAKATVASSPGWKRGAGRLIDLGGTTTVFYLVRTPAPSVADALAGDWERVGRHLSHATDRWVKERQQQDRSKHGK